MPPLKKRGRGAKKQDSSRSSSSSPAAVTPPPEPSRGQRAVSSPLSDVPSPPAEGTQQEGKEVAPKLLPPSAPEVKMDDSADDDPLSIPGLKTLKRAVQASPSTTATSETSSSIFTQQRKTFSRLLDQLIVTLRQKREKDGRGPTEVELNELVDGIMAQLGASPPGTVVDEKEAKKEEDKTEGEKQTDKREVWRKDARKSVVDRGLEEMLLDNIAEDAEPYDDVCDLFDVALTFSEREYADHVIVFSNMGVLLPTVTLQGCRRLFSYILLRRTRLTLGIDTAKGKGPYLLRLLNDLIRRLPKSKPEDVVFSGQILMFMSDVFPLGEKSGVNLRGNFNVGKNTVWEENNEDKDMAKESSDKTEDAKMEVEEEGHEVEPTTEEFYDTFWSLQHVFTNPPALFASNSTASRAPTPIASTSSHPTAVNDFPSLKAAITLTLNKFSQATKREKELLGAEKEKGEGTLTSKPDLATDSAMSEEEVVEHYFFPRFLTSRNLLDLEIADPAFRRQILIQILVLFQYLLSATDGSRAKLALLSTKNSLAQCRGILSSTDEKWIGELSTKAWTEMEKMEGGAQFRHTVELILLRDQNWINWKLKGCPPFSKLSITEAQVPAVKVSSAKATQAVRLVGKRPKLYMHGWGNQTLSTLWSQNRTSLDMCVPPTETQTLDELYSEFTRLERDISMLKKRRTLLETAQPPPASLASDLASIDDKISSTTIRLDAVHWRTFRQAGKDHTQHWAKLSQHADLNELMKNIETANSKSTIEVDDGLAPSTPARELAEGEDEVQTATTTEPLGRKRSTSIPPLPGLADAMAAIASPKRPREDVEMDEAETVAKKLKTDEEDLLPAE